MRYVIGIDIGTSNTKAVAYTADGQVLDSGGVSYPVFTDAGGMHELDPGQLLDAVLTVLPQVIARRKSAGDEPAAVALSCAMHSLLLVDERGEPLTRAITWADVRSEPYAKTLKGSDAGRRIYQRTGTPIHAMSPLCKLLWLKDRQPALFHRAARFIGIKEYIWWRLFGSYRVDHSIASATGLFDIRDLCWYRESLEVAGIQAGQLSEPVAAVHLETDILPVWRSLGLPGGLPFVIGGSDGCLANLGTGAVHAGATALTIGTSGAVRMATGTPENDPQERIFSYLLTTAPKPLEAARPQGQTLAVSGDGAIFPAVPSGNIYICGGATNNGGNAVQWYADLILGKGRWDAAALDRLTAEAETVPAGCEGLIFLPYLLGERSPIWDAGAKGVFFGVRSIHGQPHFTRAVLEGISYGMRGIGTSLEETIGPIAQIFASGGFTRNKSWLQLLADLFGKPVYVTAQADASAIGAAMMGWYALGVFSRIEEAAALIKAVAVYEPGAQIPPAYMQNCRIFSEIYSRLKDLM
jgi:gluconokinase